MKSSRELVELQGVSFTYGAEAILEDISLTVRKGDFVGVIGPNGSGKTTLLRIILGLLVPQQGSVSLFGQQLEDFRDWFRIGYVPQKVAQIEMQFPVTVAEIVSQGRFAKAGWLHRLGLPDRQAVDRALAAVGMLPEKYRLLRELSGGQQQRVFIARALASEPELLILDEPTTGVDVESQEEFYTLLARLKTEQSLTLVMISHDVDVIVNEVNRLVCINKRLVYHGSPTRFIAGDYLEKAYGKSRSLIVHGH